MRFRRPVLVARSATVEERAFALRGELLPLIKGAPGPQGHKPTRAMAGWLMVYALIGPNGGLQPVRDRDGQVMEAASELHRIDWTEYLEKGHWNDTHTERIVGHSTSLEFHDGSTELAKAHRKVGFFTSGHLFDRADPSSWLLYTDHRPSDAELRRADDFWLLATCLKGTPRPLGFSAHGLMALSPCKSRVLYAKCDQSAICELPKNPGSTAEIMELALQDSPLEWMRKGVIDRHDKPCRTCTCPPGAACLRLAKGAMKGGSIRGGEDSILEMGTGAALDLERDPAARIEALIQAIMRRFFVNREDACRYVAMHLQRQGEKPDADHQPSEA